jgi:hypothetical protein
MLTAFEFPVREATGCWGNRPKRRRRFVADACASAHAPEGFKKRMSEANSLTILQCPDIFKNKLPSVPPVGQKEWRTQYGTKRACPMGGTLDVSRPVGGTLVSIVDNSCCFQCRTRSSNITFPSGGWHNLIVGYISGNFSTNCVDLEAVARNYFN